MKNSTLDWLRCPSCHGSFHSTTTGATTAVNDYDILFCRCSQYPVVDGIPIIKKGIIGTARQTADEVISLIRAGRRHEALLSMIMPRPPGSPALAPTWLKTLPAIKGINRLKAYTHAWFLRSWRERTAALLDQSGDDVTVSDLLDCYFRQSGARNDDIYVYFAFRFGQPRHLVALSFVNLVHLPQRPILDLCCGLGHITRSLVQQSGAQPVIGLDRSFFGLYVAKTRIAPEAKYVCAEASQPLPFPDRTFSAVFCVDGFHTVMNKAATIQRLKRITEEEGLIVLVASRNAQVENPYSCEPLTPEGYQALVADMPHCLVADRDVLTAYLQRKGPPLAHSASAERLVNEPLLSVVAAHRREVFRDHGFFPDWPHAEGRLRLNPLFVEAERDQHGKALLRRAFPSAYYEQENPEYNLYLPENVVVDSDVLRDVGAGRRTPAMEPLITQCVVVGMPEGY
jgi:SAM-dependent methyltransferase/uncharacterized protein YbaR (Trm112 family)